MALPSGLHPGLHERALKASAWVREQGAAGRCVTIVHHIDADGVASAAVAATTLQRAGVAHLLQPVKSLDETHLAKIEALGPEALWFCDLGSTAYMRFPSLPRLVCDHHQLVRDGSEESFPHVNPLLDGLPGESISGAGCAYLVAAATDERNLDLLPLALVGASADLQDRRGGFHGANAALLQQGIGQGLLAARTDLAWYGTESRPLRKFLNLAREPAVPGVTGDRAGADALMAAVDAKPSRPWAAQEPHVQLALRTRLVERLLDCGMAGEVPRLLRTVVTLPAEPVGSPTRELQEYGTLLNGTARYGRPEVGLAVARGDRGAMLEAALGLLGDHRKHLVGALDAFAARQVQEVGRLQWIHLEDRVLDTVVGIVAGMALEALQLRRDKPLVAFAYTPDGRTKASARAPHELLPRGLDLASAMRDAAAHVGGQGGGHLGAAGATLPREAETAFLEALDRCVAAQLRPQALPAVGARA